MLELGGSRVSLRYTGEIAPDNGNRIGYFKSERM
jgi:hypothetical protein